MRYANITSSLALFVALGGTGYAAVKLPRNSVNAKQIAPGAVRSSEVKNHSLKAVDFAVLPQGPKGDKGDKGDPGAPGKDATQVVLATGSDSSTTDFDIGASTRQATPPAAVDCHDDGAGANPGPGGDHAEGHVYERDAGGCPLQDLARRSATGARDGNADQPGDLSAAAVQGRDAYRSRGHGTQRRAAGRDVYVTLHCLSNEPGAAFDAGDLTVLAVAG